MGTKKAFAMVPLGHPYQHGWNHIDKHNLAPRINLLTRGRGYHWKGWYYEPDQNTLTNLKTYPDMPVKKVTWN